MKEFQVSRRRFVQRCAAFAAAAGVPAWFAERELLAAEGSDLVVSKPVYGGGVVGQYVVRGTTRLVTVRTGVLEGAAGAASGARGDSLIRTMAELGVSAKLLNQAR